MEIMLTTGGIHIPIWNAPLYNGIKNYTESLPTVFHMPGHKLGRGFPEEVLKEMVMLDVTEVPGTDNLHDPDGIIKEAQQLAAYAFGADETFFLVNGSTCGIHAMIMTACKPGDKLIVARDCHKSVISGMMLAGVNPVYIKPDFDDCFDITTVISPERLERMLLAHPDAVGVFITRPNYYGICADIDQLSKITHKHGKMLIVDEAHGAHLKFCSSLPKCAMDSGADICVQSAHKTLPALTQSAYLHVKGNRIDRDRLRNNLHMLQTSSPSYVLMSFLDIARAILQEEGSQQLSRLLADIQWLKQSLSACTGTIVLTESMLDASKQDGTRLVINTKNMGTSGFENERLLRTEFNIQVEMADMHNIVCITTIADDRKVFAKLLSAMQELSGRFKDARPLADIIIGETDIPEQKIGLKEMMQVKTKRIRLQEAAGKTCGDIITPYPPGVPVLCPGEIISEEAIHYIAGIADAGGNVNGLNGNLEVRIVE